MTRRERRPHVADDSTEPAAKARERLCTGYGAQLGPLLAIDVLTTHCPDRLTAAAGGRSPGDVLGERITRGIAQEQHERRHRLESRVQSLITHHLPEDVLACATSHLLRGHLPG
ncbi:hypothetical protein SSOG_04673 [Streptomyces himastatinicus ATCC 53653]|uniref:Uncharacterized protein n=1 Tax=Streptomyces himastatinicus ATCC 53653 TaxID=457427 RepID=D9WBK3_9ACTN|nr:hypothetical protein SSOG_04673 [Streptomyces himastatinicus ATCC 53653]